MKRGDIVIATSRGDYTGKPRPAIVMQSNFFDETNSLTLLLMTGSDTDAPLLRVPIAANAETGLATSSWAMVDKVVTVKRSAIGEIIGRVDPRTMLEISRRLAVFLGIA